MTTTVCRARNARSRLARLALEGCRAWLPHRCLLCDGVGSAGLDLCAVCLSVLPAMHRPLEGWLACLTCGEAFAPDGQDASETCGGARCERCRKRASPFARIVAPFRFSTPIDAWVRALKHDRAMPVARIFGTVIAGTTGAADALHIAAAPPLLIPVPMHERRRRERGFNHAEAIAHWIGRASGLTVSAAAAVRVLDTGSLAERSRAERQVAIRGAFQVHAALADRHVVLVDDVLTSGATAGELARECHDTGAASVSLLVAARTCVDALGPAPFTPPRVAPCDSSLDSTVGSPV